MKKDIPQTPANPNYEFRAHLAKLIEEKAELLDKLALPEVLEALSRPSQEKQERTTGGTMYLHKKTGQFVEAKRFGNAKFDAGILKEHGEELKDWLKSQPTVEAVHFTISVSRSYIFTFTSWGEKFELRWGDVVVFHPNSLKPFVYKTFPKDLYEKVS